MSYSKVRLLRAWHDSTLARGQFQIRATIAFITIALLYLYLRFSPALEYLGLGYVAISDVEISKATTAAVLAVSAAAAFVFVTLSIHWFKAPQQIWKEDQDTIAGLKRQLKPDVKITVFPAPFLLAAGDMPVAFQTQIVFYRQKRYIVCNNIGLSSTEEQSVTVDVVLMVVDTPGAETGWVIDPLSVPLTIWENHPNRPPWLAPTRMLVLPAQLSPSGKRADSGYVAFEVDPFQPRPDDVSTMWFRIAVVNHRKRLLDMSEELGLSFTDLTERNPDDEPEIRSTFSRLKPGTWADQTTQL